MLFVWPSYFCHFHPQYQTPTINFRPSVTHSASCPNIISSTISSGFVFGCISVYTSTFSTFLKHILFADFISNVHHKYDFLDSLKQLESPDITFCISNNTISVLQTNINHDIWQLEASQSEQCILNAIIIHSKPTSRIIWKQSNLKSTQGSPNFMAYIVQKNSTQNSTALIIMTTPFSSWSIAPVYYFLTHLTQQPKRMHFKLSMSQIFWQ